MNICILGQYPPQIGGIATYTKQVQDYLESNGHNVYILTYSSNIPRDKNIYEVNVINIPILRGISFIFRAKKILKNIIQEHDIDIVHSNYIIPPGLVSSLVKETNVKNVTTVHGSDINILPNNKLLRPLIKYVLKNMDEIYFVSEELYQKALNLNIPNLEEKSMITPNKVNINKFKPIADDKRTLKDKYTEPIVIFIGNLVEQKGLKYLLEAKKISKTNYTLLIYGDGPKKEELKKYILENKLNNTYLMDKTNTPEKIIPESDIMILPSISEGASIVALESMSCEKPLIATDTGNISQVITNNENGIIVPTKNPEELRNAIDELVSKPELRKKIGKSARELIIKKYSKIEIPYLNEQ